MGKKYFVWSTIIWTLIIMGFYALICVIIVSNNKKVVLNKSQAFFEQLLTTRSWNAQHSGVYVPVTDSTQPNIIEKIEKQLSIINGQLIMKAEQLPEISGQWNMVNFPLIC